MKVKKKLDSSENREYWEFVERTSKEVDESFPNWKRGERAEFNKSDSGDETRRMLPQNGSSNGSGMKC